MSRRARYALLPLGLAFAVGAELVRLSGGWPIGWVLADLVPGIAFLVAGQVAWERRPGNRIGPLMVATGFAWYVGTYGGAFDPVITRLAYAFQGYYDALLAWLVLAFPTGILRSRPARLVVAAFFGLLLVRSAVRLVLFRLSTEYDFGNPADVDRYIADFGLRDAADGIFRIAIAVLSVVVIGLIAWRFRTETAVGRRVALPILLGGLAFAIGVVIEVGSLAVAGSFAERSAAWDLGQTLAVVTGTLIPIGFAVGVARSRLARGSVADLVLELDATAEPRTLTELLARTLRDPSLQVAYPVDGTGRFVDAAGAAVTLPAADDPARATTRLERGGSTLAVLVHDPAIAEEPELIRSITAAAGLALDNERLAAEVRRQLDEVRASRARIVVAGDAERRRVERDLHDGAQQRLVTLALTLQLARGQADGTNLELAATLDRAATELGQALAELRDLARGLHPTVLTEEGLRAAVEALADRTPVAVTVSATERRFPATVESTAYFVVAEALTNVAKYAGAGRATVRIETDGAGETLTVEVADDGIGGADPRRGSGLRGLDDRVAAAGGRLTVESPAGEGTTIRAELPCA